MEKTLEDRLDRIKTSLHKHPCFIEEDLGKDYCFNLNDTFYVITLHDNDFKRLNSKEFENFENTYYLGCGVDVTPIFGQSKNMVFQDRDFGCHYNEEGIVWPNLMCILEQAGLITDLKPIHYKGNHSQFEFKTEDDIKKNLFVYFGDYTKNIHPDLRKADYVHNAASLIDVPIKLVPELKIGCVICADEFHGVATREPERLKEMGLEKIGERLWKKVRHVDAKQIEELNLRYHKRLVDKRIRFLD
jgi:hypothetical protein